MEIATPAQGRSDGIIVTFMAEFFDGSQLTFSFPFCHEDDAISELVKPIFTSTTILTISGTVGLTVIRGVLTLVHCIVAAIWRAS